MGEALDATNDFIAKEHKTRPHTSLGLPNASQQQSRSSSRLSDPWGSPELQWKPSSKYIDPGYGYQKEWRSSRARVEGGGDSHLGSNGTPRDCEDDKQWRSSIRYINPGSGSKSTAQWRSSIKAVKPNCNNTYPQWKPTVRVFKLSECCTEWTMRGGRRHVPAVIHCEPAWRSCRGPGQPSPLVWAPPFRTHNRTPPKTRELRGKVPGYAKKHPQLQLFSPTLEMADKSNPGNSLTPNAKEIRAKVAAYFKLHPPLHLFSSSFKPGYDVTDSSQAETYHSIRRYIPEGHENHFEKSGCTPRASTKPPLSSIRMWSATGPQHDPGKIWALHYVKRLVSPTFQDRESICRERDLFASQPTAGM